MEIIDLSNYNEKRFNTAVALGNFDGIHIGHQNLIKTMISKAKEMKLKSSLLLFKEHTKATINEHSPKCITSLDQKIRIAKKLGVEIIYLIDFDENLMKLTPKEFVKQILLQKINSKLVVVGFDYKFGYRALGNSKTLNELSDSLDFKVKILSPVYSEGIIASSSNIRQLINDGNVEQVKNILQREYSIIGKVVRGENRGNKLGFPTANIELQNNYVIPKTGVYKTLTIVDDKVYNSATNIGYNPTFNDNGDKDLKIETYILDFNQNIYGKTIEVRFKRYIREDIKFKSVDDLVSQMKLDIKEVEKED